MVMMMTTVLLPLEIVVGTKEGLDALYTCLLVYFFFFWGGGSALHVSIVLSFSFIIVQNEF